MTGLAPSPAIKTRDRLEIGSAVIHRLADIEGIAWPATALFRDLTGDALRDAAARYPAAVNAGTGTLTLSFNSYIIDTPDVLCLIDTGIGNGKERPDRPAWHRRSGDFMQRLAALGYAPEKFDLVINTHLHADHVGWNTTADGAGWRPTFRNARYVVGKSELAHWQGVYAKDRHATHGAFADSVQPIVEAGLCTAVDLPAEVAPGLFLEPAPGHTRGMAVVRLKLSACDILFLADALHSPVQLTTPDLTSNFCVDPDEARATRRRLLDACARSNTIVAAYHFPPPVFGRIVGSGPDYLLEPVT